MATKVRFTTAYVHRLSEAVCDVTDHAFRLGYTGGDIGNGTRFVDSVRQQVWLGRTGGAEASAYYAHAAIAYAERNEREIPEIIREAADVTSTHRAAIVREWADRGASEGEYAWRVDNDGLNDTPGMVATFHYVVQAKFDTYRPSGMRVGWEDLTHDETREDAERSRSDYLARPDYGPNVPLRVVRRRDRTAVDMRREQPGE